MFPVITGPEQNKEFVILYSSCCLNYTKIMHSGNKPCVSGMIFYKHSLLPSKR